MAQQEGSDDSEWPVYRPPGTPEDAGPQRYGATPAPDAEPTYGDSSHGSNTYGNNAYGSNTYGSSAYGNKSYGDAYQSPTSGNPYQQQQQHGPNLYATNQSDGGTNGGRWGARYVPWVAGLIFFGLMITGQTRFIFIVIIAMVIWHFVRKRS